MPYEFSIHAFSFIMYAIRRFKYTWLDQHLVINSKSHHGANLTAKLWVLLLTAAPPGLHSLSLIFNIT